MWIRILCGTGGSERSPATEVVQVALRLGAVPELLDEREEQLLVEPVGVRAPLEREVRVEVDAAVEERRVVRRRARRGSRA